MINNNQLQIKFNEDNICRDFEIFRITRENGYFYGLKALDIPNLEFHAESVYFAQSKVIYTLFKKGTVNKEILKKVLCKECEDIRVEKVDIKKALHLEEPEKPLYPNQMAQLLFNSLGKPQNEKWSYNNITGALYYWNPEWQHKNRQDEMDYFWTIKIELTNKLYVKLSVDTFSSLKALHKKYSPVFCFDKNSMRFRRSLSEDQIDEKNLYANKAVNKKKHNNVPFMNFKDYESFNASKMGVFSKFLLEIDKSFIEYVSVQMGDFENYETTELPDETFSMGKKAYGQALAEKGVTIIDLVQSEESVARAEHIKEQLQNYFGVSTINGSELNKDSYNIRIIRNKDHYEDQEDEATKISDPHNDLPPGYIVQHITTDDFKIGKDSKENAAVTKSVQELLIKGDIQKGTISLTRWSEYGYNDIWKFVKRKAYDIYVPKDGKTVKQKSYIFYRMTINPDGKFTFDLYDQEELTMDNELLEIKRIFDFYDDPKKRYLERQIDGLVYSNILQPNIILQTEQFTIPKIKQVSKALELSKGSRVLPVEYLLEYAKQYKEVNDNVKYEKNIEELIEFLKSTGQEVLSYKEVNRILNMRTDFAKDFNDYLYTNYAILINSRLRREELRSDLFEAVLNIKYFYDGNKLLYFVGTRNKALQTSLCNSCKIREVTSPDMKPDFEQLVKLMAVDFVKNGQFTVLPFPFKYLSEYVRLNGNRQD